MRGSLTPKRKYRGKVENAQLLIEDRAEFRQKVLLLEGREFELTLDQWHPKRSIQQNKYLHACIGILAWHIGYTPAEMKVVLKNEFDIEYTRSLTTAQCTVFIENIR